MLKELILINSANFEFAKILVDRDMFFGGSNGTGKTTTIRALQYLFVSDEYLLGLDSNKKSFKEYYFPDSNSFVIYVFEQFFIILYKKSGQIIKYFSKQKFDIERIVDKDTDGEIQKYIKEAPLYYKVEKIDEFRAILYGQNRKFLDFSITNIKDYKSFIKLFAGVFDIQKAITSTDDIKIAIYKSMVDYQNSSIDFDANEFLSKIFGFKKKLNYFKTFESQKRNITKCYNLKDEVVELESNIDILKSKIKYRYEFEKTEVKEQESKLDLIKKELDLIATKERFLENFGRKFIKKLDYYIMRNNLKLEEVTKLKERFSDEKIKEAREYQISLPNLLKDKNAKEESKRELEREHKNLQDELDKEKEREHNSLKSKELEIKERYREERDRLKSKYDSKLDEIDMSFNNFRESQDSQAELKQSEIDNLSFEINRLKDKKRDIERESFNKMTKESEFITMEIDSLHKKIYLNASQKSDTQRDIKKFEANIEDLERVYKRNYSDRLDEYRKKTQKIDKAIEQLKGSLDVKSGSFREFLDDNVKNWERELYPILDKKLLNMTNLNAKLLRSEHIFGISLNLDNLEQIKSKREILDEINKLELDLKRLEEDFTNKNTLQISNKNLQEDSINKEIKNLYLQIKQIDDWFESDMIKLDNLKSQKNSKDTQIQKESKEKLDEVEIKITELNNSISKLKIEKLDIKKSIDLKREEINRFKKELKNNFQDDEIKLERGQKNEFEKEKIQIQKKIDKINQQMLNISSDEKLRELNSEIALLNKEIEHSRELEYFLREYELKKAEIKQENLLKADRVKFENRLKIFEQKMEVKRDNLNRESENLKENQEQIKKQILDYKEGVERIDIQEFIDVDMVESNKILLELLKSFDESNTIYFKKYSEFKKLLEKLKKLMEFSQVGNYQFNEEQELKLRDDEISSEFIIHLNELLKLNVTHKSTESIEFKTLIERISKNLSNLSHKERDLIKKVRDVNRVLSDATIDVLSDIEIKTTLLDNKSFTKLSDSIAKEIDNILLVFAEDSLFFDKADALNTIESLEKLIESLRNVLAEDENLAFSGVDLKLKFLENNQVRNNIKHFKNIGSNGTSILLKIIIITAILSIYIDKEKSQPFYLIIDEIGAIEKNNQDAIRKFAISHGFTTVFSTTNPILSKPEDIRYYRFAREGSGFEVISLNR